MGWKIVPVLGLGSMRNDIGLVIIDGETGKMLPGQRSVTIHNSCDDVATVNVELILSHSDGYINIDINEVGVYDDETGAVVFSGGA